MNAKDLIATRVLWFPLPDTETARQLLFSTVHVCVTQGWEYAGSECIANEIAVFMRRQLKGHR
jgi:hypothetical protein